MSTELTPNHAGKRLPYSVPDGYFDSVEDSVMQEISRRNLQRQPIAPQHKKRGLRVAAIALVTSIAAAVVVGFFILTPNTTAPVAPQEQVTDIAQVEQAFNELSTEDQDYLVSVYEDDVFMDEFINSQTNEEQ